MLQDPWIKLLYDTAELGDYVKISLKQQFPNFRPWFLDNINVSELSDLCRNMVVTGGFLTLDAEMTT